MENSFEKIEEIAKRLKEYTSNAIDLAKLDIAEKSSKAISAILSAMIALLFFGLCYTFLLLLMALYIGEMLNQLTLGFLIVAAFQFVIGMIFWKWRRRIFRTPILNAILSHFFNQMDSK
jgi:uncharacterized membrane protein YqjE